MSKNPLKYDIKFDVNNMDADAISNSGSVQEQWNEQMQSSVSDRLDRFDRENEELTDEAIVNLLVENQLNTIGITEITSFSADEIKHVQESDLGRELKETALRDRSLETGECLKGVRDSLNSNNIEFGRHGSAYRVGRFDSPDKPSLLEQTDKFMKVEVSDLTTFNTLADKGALLVFDRRDDAKLTDTGGKVHGHICYVTELNDRYSKGFFEVSDHAEPLRTMSHYDKKYGGHEIYMTKDNKLDESFLLDKVKNMSNEEKLALLERASENLSDKTEVNFLIQEVEQNKSTEQSAAERQDVADTMTKDAKIAQGKIKIFENNNDNQNNANDNVASETQSTSNNNSYEASLSSTIMKLKSLQVSR